MAVMTNLGWPWLITAGNGYLWLTMPGLTLTDHGWPWMTMVDHGWLWLNMAAHRRASIYIMLTMSTGISTMLGMWIMIMHGWIQKWPPISHGWLAEVKIRAMPCHGSQEHVCKIWRKSILRFLSYRSGPTDRRTQLNPISPTEFTPVGDNNLW